MKKLILVSLLAVFAQLSHGQVLSEILKKEKAPSVGIALVPQYAIMGGMRIDADVRVNERHYLTIAPQLYYSKESYMYPPDETSFSGGGLKLTYRYFPAKKAKGEGGYLGFGLDYKYMSFNYDDYYYYSFVEEDVEYSSVTYGENHKSFNQGGFDILIGYQFKFSSQFYLDFYTGWGFRLSNYTQDDDDYSWGSDILDPGYSGFVPMAGIRIGIFLD